MLDLDDATTAMVNLFEGSILGVGIETEKKSDLGEKILSKEWKLNKGRGRAYPASPDAKWIKSHVPSIAFWQIGFNPTSDYHIKGKIIDKDERQGTVTTQDEYYRSRILLQVEMYLRTVFERSQMEGQINTLLNTAGRGTGRITTPKGNWIYLTVLDSRFPQEEEFQEQGIERLVFTMELKVRDLVKREEPMLKNTKLTVRHRNMRVY